MDVSKLLKGLGTGGVLTPYLDDYLGAGRFPDEWHITIPNFKYDDGLFHPSGATYTDPRTLYFDRQDVRKMIAAGIDQKLQPPRQISAQLRRTFDWGHMAHGYYGAILMEMGFVIEANVERKVHGFDGLGSGTADLVDVEVPGKGKWLVDMKTMNSRDFRAGPRVELLQKWQAQVNCYAAWVGADQAMILAIEKDSPHGLKEIPILTDDNLLDEIYERWVYVEECLQADIPPPCDHPFGHPCSLHDRCYYEED